jgi:hypothetical protein
MVTSSMGNRRRADWDKRFLSRLVPQQNGCLLYEGPSIGDGRYGCIWTGSPERAHRYAWRREKGPIPRGLKVLHSCDNTRCCRVSHLFLGTLSDNMQDMAAKLRGLHGSKHPLHKLDDEKVRAILSDQRTQQAIADDYGVNQTVVSKLKRGQIWRHITRI